MKNQILKVLIILLVITLLGAGIAPIGSYAAVKIVSAKTNTEENNKVTITNKITGKTSKVTITNKTNNSTKKSTTTETNTTTNNTTTNKNTTTTTTETTKTETNNTSKTTVVPSSKSKTLTSVYETMKENLVSKEEKKDGIETIEANLETYIHKSYGYLENVEIGSNIVYTIYLKNNSTTTKTVQLKSSMKESILGGKIMASTYKVEPVVEQGVTYKGTTNEQQIIYRELMSITLRPNEEKAIKLEQKVENYVSSKIRNVFTIILNNEEKHLEDTKQMVAPAKLNAEVKLYVNDAETPSNKKIQLKENDKVQYELTLANNGGSNAEINIKDTLPKGFEISKIEYLDQKNKLISAVEHSGNQLNIEKMEIKPNETIKLLLTVKVRTTVNRQIENSVEISGDTIKTLNTNTATNIFVGKNVSDNEIVDTKSFKKEQTVSTKGTTTNNIISYFGDTSFKAYKGKVPVEIQYKDRKNATVGTFNYSDVGAKLTMFAEDMFHAKKMFCVKMGTGYWRWFTIENFYTMYEGNTYRYNKTSKQLEKNNMPQSGVGIGNEYYGDLINKKYNELAYILSEIDRYDEPSFYTIIGIDPSLYQGNDYNDRPLYSLSPVQIAIWKLEGVPESTIKTKMKNELSDLGIEPSSTQGQYIINVILAYANTTYAQALAYDKYVDNNNIGSIPNITTNFKNIKEINGKQLVGPFKVSYPITTGSTTYTDATGKTTAVNGLYGQITEVSVKNGTTTYTELYNEKGERIYVSQNNDDTLEFYIDVKGKNFDGTKETKVTAKMNNQYRNAYCYTLSSNYDKQPFIIGYGKMSLGTYDATFKLEVEKMTLSGKVWLDVQQGEKTGQIKVKAGNEVRPPNGIIDENEKGMKDITVYLIDKTAGKKVKATITNENGEYAFKDVPKSEYYILFEYDGINYIETSTGKDSKASENITINGKNIRTNFNERFNNIFKDKVITKTYEVSNSGEVEEKDTNTTMSYMPKLLENGEREAQLITNVYGMLVPGYEMISKTTKTYNQTTNNINFGLIKRVGDLSLRTKMFFCFLAFSISIKDLLI